MLLRSVGKSIHIGTNRLRAIIRQSKFVKQIRGKAVIPVKSVLICDGEPIIRASILDKLKELGFDTLFECCDAKSALSMACEYLPDIAIMDAAIPQNSGLNAACEIRQKLKIPVILLMSQCDPNTLNQAKTNGITTILNKPLRGQDLLPAIEMATAHANEVKRLKADLEDLNKAIENMQIIDKAKKVLMRSKGLSESEAFRSIQKLAMDKQKSMRQIAEAIFITEGV
jgi:two-component system, response regulator PdtaR